MLLWNIRRTACKRKITLSAASFSLLRYYGIDSCSYQNDLSKDALTDSGLESALHNQVYIDSKKLGKLYFERHEIKEARRASELYQNVEVAVFPLMPTHIRTEDAYRIYAISLS